MLKCTITVDYTPAEMMRNRNYYVQYACKNFGKVKSNHRASVTRLALASLELAVVDRSTSLAYELLPELEFLLVLCTTVLSYV